jgi:hypothetical protein
MRQRYFFAAISMVLAFAIGIVPTSVVSAPSEGILNKLFAPGQMIEGHKDLEQSDCLKCHDAGQGVPDTKCLACHKELNRQVRAGTSFHGQTKKNCIECHSDHKGRAFDTTLIDEKKFDHAKTGYSMEGKHADLKCSECHNEKRDKKSTRTGDIRYFGKENTCNSCHKKHDVHYFKGDWAAKECNACHGTKTWKSEIKFDHTRDAKYKLVGKHAQMKCAECHNPEKDKRASKYNWPTLEKSECLACHEDTHKTLLSPKFRGGDCTQCHSQTVWKIPKFDHGVTSYRLKGKHDETQCIDCHKQAPGVAAKDTKHYNWTGLSTRCLSCHKEEHYFGTKPSPHLGDLNACSKCHTERDWKTTHSFNHTSDTRFAITGKHLDVSCAKCHLPSTKAGHSEKAKSVVPAGNAKGIYQWSDLQSKTCELCHTNPHLKQFTKDTLKKSCTECHTSEGWKVFPKKADKNFNHSQTRFELTGSHQGMSCNKCHVKDGKQIFKFASQAQQFCVDCHDNQHLDQFHKDRSAQSCAECHSTTTFSKLKPFDHSRTAFTLRGAHADLKCNDCHSATAKSFLTKPPKVKHQFLFPGLGAKGCTTCHDDYHKGQLSNECQKCHSEKSWKKPNFVHNRDSSFKLSGEHEDLKCNACHKPRKGEVVVFAGVRSPVVQFKPIPSKCSDCHKDIHKGNFGSRCEECHADTGWKKTKDFHRNFTLHGSHFLAECSECHRDNARLAGMSTRCQVCHQRDDVHSGTLPSCDECHRQEVWEVPNFRHSMTRFPLRGVHRTLDCFECHSGGLYQGAPSDCVRCHKDAATGAAHTLPQMNDCAHCHTQFTFRK